jgi:hypothetical protein
VTSDAVCDAVQERMTEALLARAAPAAPDLLHAEGCAACAACRDELAALRSGLDAFAAPELAPELGAAVRRRALAELARRGAPARAGLPDGFGRELGRVLGGALAALPLVLAWNAAVLFFGGELLRGLVPAGLAAGLGAAYAVAAAGWLAFSFGALPLVAQGQARRRLQEVSS